MNLKPHPYGEVDVDADDDDDDDHDNDDDHHLFTFGGTLCILKRLFHMIVFTSVMHISWGTPIN